MSEKEFRDIVTKYQDRVYNTCLGFLKNAEDAEDIAQEVFIQVYKSYDTFLEKSELGTWIYRLAVNKNLEEIRKRSASKRKVESESIDNKEPASPSNYHPGVTLENKERSKILMSAIDKLPENQNVAFTLSKIEGLSQQEISKVMNKSISSVEALLQRAKLKLRELLKDYYEGNKYI